MAKMKELKDIKIYLASSMDTRFRKTIKDAAEILRMTFNEVYVPMEHEVTNAWDYPNNEWGLMVFEDDLCAINRSDYVVFLNYGRENTTAGCAWEAGYAFASGKKVFVVDVNELELTLSDTDDIEQIAESLNKGFITSLMVENGRYATINGLGGLREYDWVALEKTRTLYEQK